MVLPPLFAALTIQAGTDKDRFAREDKIHEGTFLTAILTGDKNRKNKRIRIFRKNLARKDIRNRVILFIYAYLFR